MPDPQVRKRSTRSRKAVRFEVPEGVQDAAQAGWVYRSTEKGEPTSTKPARSARPAKGRGPVLVTRKAGRAPSSSGRARRPATRKTGVDRVVETAFMPLQIAISIVLAAFQR